MIEPGSVPASLPSTLLTTTITNESDSPDKDPTIMNNSFGSRAQLSVDGRDYTIFRLDAVYKSHPGAQRLPYSLKILLENLLRTEDGLTVRPDDITALANWDPNAHPTREIAF